MIFSLIEDERKHYVDSFFFLLFTQFLRIQGISGVEGLQAAGASDYSIAQFKFLNRLLFVHGAWNYSRMCKLILYSFYKNICFCMIELWYAIYSGWSGQILFDRWSIGLFNVVSSIISSYTTPRQSEKDCIFIIIFSL